MKTVVSAVVMDKTGTLTYGELRVEGVVHGIPLMNRALKVMVTCLEWKY